MVKLDLRKTPSSPDQINSPACLAGTAGRAANGFSSIDVSSDTSPSEKTFSPKVNSPLERTILRKSSKAVNEQSDDLKPILDAYHLAKKRLLFLDYDGTIVPFAPKPDQAKPAAETLSVIGKLSKDKLNTVIIISGRDERELDDWLGHLPVHLIAEHGTFEKRAGVWQPTVNIDESWKEQIRQIMQPFVQKTPGTLLEEKKSGLVFHYRNAFSRVNAAKIADELYRKLKPTVEKQGLHISHSSMVVEVRCGGADKGQAAQDLLASGNYDFVLCAGDSQTDEDMFNELKSKAFCIKVGVGKTAANYRVSSPEALLNFLEACA